MKAVLQKNYDILRDELGSDVSILPTIGNNDVTAYNKAPCTDAEATLFYSELYDIWFPAGSQPSGFDDTAAKATFLHGGYYSYDFPNTNITLLAVNSVAFKVDNSC
mmetsp:Transcript_19391/g.29766  ORF Transcript_19391/g.29766 Transcript_19391/m.29766 type:complete len:106 (+) Transcript_19391:520-837(+)